MTSTLVPLTTVFTPPSDCARRLFTMGKYDDPSTEARLYWDISFGDTATLSCQSTGMDICRRGLQDDVQPGCLP
jgi:hypothetical protein